VNNSIQIAIIEDDSLMANLLNDYLNSVKGLAVKRIIQSVEDYFEWEKLDEPIDVLLLDLRLKDASGQEIIDHLKQIESSYKIIVLSSHYSPNYLGYMFRKGVHAFIPKEIQKDDLVNVIRNVFEIGHYFSEEQLNILRQQISSNVVELPKNAVETISDREKEVLKLHCHQYTAKEIAEKMFISRKTVEAHKANLLLKSGAKNTAGLIIFATQTNLVNLNEIML